jgi:hypothetical protein
MLVEEAVLRIASLELSLRYVAVTWHFMWLCYSAMVNERLDYTRRIGHRYVWVRDKAPSFHKYNHTDL